MKGRYLAFLILFNIKLTDLAVLKPSKTLRM